MKINFIKCYYYKVNKKSVRVVEKTKKIIRNITLKNFIKYDILL